MSQIEVKQKNEVVESPTGESREVFAAIRDLGPEELFSFLEQVAQLLPEDVRYRLRQVIDTAGREHEPLQRVLEVVRAQWEGLQADDSLRIVVLGPARSGKSSLIAAIGEGQVHSISDLFPVVDLQGLDEYLGYGRQERLPEEVAAANVILLVLDGSRGFTDQTEHLVRKVASLGKPSLVVLNKMDIAEHPRRVVEEARSRFKLPIVPASIHRRRSVRRILRALVAAHPRALYGLTQHLPGFRRGICRGIAAQSAFGSGLVGAIPIPVGDVLPVSAIQTAMLLKIARAHGFRINRERARELIPMFAAGLLVREGSRKLTERFPEKERLISVAVAGSWTYLVGMAAVSYFEGLSRYAAAEKERALA